jgi:hypothetical protein
LCGWQRRENGMRDGVPAAEAAKIHGSTLLIRPALNAQQ